MHSPKRIFKILNEKDRYSRQTVSFKKNHDEYQPPPPNGTKRTKNTARNIAQSQRAVCSFQPRSSWVPSDRPTVRFCTIVTRVTTSQGAGSHHNPRMSVPVWVPVPPPRPTPSLAGLGDEEGDEQGFTFFQMPPGGGGDWSVQTLATITVFFCSNFAVCLPAIQNVLAFFIARFGFFWEESTLAESHRQRCRMAEGVGIPTPFPSGS